MSTTWYGKSTVKELDALIEKKPKLQELLLNPDFLNELKAFNTKLLDFVKYLSKYSFTKEKNSLKELNLNDDSKNMNEIKNKYH